MGWGLRITTFNIMENFDVMKNLIFRMGGGGGVRVTKKPIYGGGWPKKGGLDSLQNWEWAWRKRGLVFLRGVDTLMYTMDFFSKGMNGNISWIYCTETLESFFSVKTTVKLQISKILNTDSDRIFPIPFKDMYVSFRYT